MHFGREKLIKLTVIKNPPPHIRLNERTPIKIELRLFCLLNLSEYQKFDFIYYQPLFHAVIFKITVGYSKAIQTEDDFYNFPRKLVFA